jgi:chorismate dehydratase
MSTPLRVGRIVALNMYPIYHHLDRTPGLGFRFTDGLPTALNQAVLSGELDVSAMSSIEYARNADRLRLLPVASIAARGAVDSIQVFSHVPFETMRTVAITPHSATSVALLRILVGPDVDFVPLTGDATSALRDVDGVLLIADEALAAREAGLGPIQTDLGERWQVLTGRPMVFAVWAANRRTTADRPADLDRLSSALHDAQEWFVRDPEPVVAAAAARFPFGPNYIRTYFTRLAYGFGPSERAGLEEFLRRARDAGELDALPALAA